MNRMLADFIPVLLFFIAFKFYGIYTATVVGIIATAVQVMLMLLMKKKVHGQQWLTLIAFIIFGGMTLYFHNPVFVKWKPTILFWIFALAFLFSRFVGSKTLIQRMMESGLGNNQLPLVFWRQLNMLWVIFFAVLGAINLYVAKSFSTNAWVNFKLYGISGLLLLFCIIQALLMSRYLTDTDKK